MSYPSQIRSLKPEPAPLPLRRRGTDPAPEEEEDPESALRKAQPAQAERQPGGAAQPGSSPLRPQPPQAAPDHMVKYLTTPEEKQRAQDWWAGKIPHDTTSQALPGGAAQPGSAPFRPQQPQAAPDHMVKYLTTPEEKQRAQDWWAGKIPHDTTSQALPGVAGPGAGQHDMFQRGVVHPQAVTMEHRQDRNSPVTDSAVPLVGRTPKPAGSPPQVDMLQSVIPQTTSKNDPQAARQVMRPGSLSPGQQPPAVASQPTAAVAQQPALAKPPANAQQAQPQPTAPATPPSPQQPPLAKPPVNAPQQQTPPAPSQAPPTASAAAQNTEEDPRVAAALKQAGAEVDAESAVRKQREDRRAHLASAGLSGTADRLDTLDAEAEAKRADLEKQFPQHGPEYEAGMQALGKHVQQQQSQIAGGASRVQQAAAEIYQHWGHGVAGNWITGEAPKEGDEYSPGAPLSRTHLDVLDQEAKKYGVDPKDLRHHLEMQRLSDWSRPSTSSANRQQESFVDRTIRQASGRGPAEPARVLPNGSITVNPALGEDQATFEKAIQNTYSTPEAKEAARKMWPAYHDRWLSEATQTLKTSKRFPGVQDYNEWLTSNQLAGHFSEKMPDGSVRPYTDNEKTQLYLDAMKSRPGWLKLADNIGTSLTAGGGQIIAAGMGAAAMGAGAVESATGQDMGAQEFSEAAADKAKENRALTQSHELPGTTDGFGTRLISSVSQALPSTVLSMVTGGGTAGAAVMGAFQTAGGQYAETYANNIDKGMDHDEAFARSAPAAAFSGVMSGLLTKAFPGGVTSLNSGAVRSTLSTGANRSALGGSITDAIKAYAATTAQGAKALARGALDEIPQEVLDEGISQLSSAYAEKRDMKQAMTDFFTGLPRLIATSGILGAGGEHIAHSGGKQAQTEQTQSQTEIPHPTTEDAAGPSGQPSPTTANNTSSEAELRRVDGQPSSTSPLSTAKPSTPPLDVETSKKLIENVSKMPAAAQQHPTTQANVAQAKGVVVADAQKRIDNISQMRPEAQQNPKVQKDLAEAQKTVEDHGQKPGDQAGALSDAQAAEAPAGPATSTHSSGGSLPPRDTSTTHGATPPTGTATGSHAGTGDTESPTSTASSRDSNAPGGGTHTTNGVTAPEIGHGNPIPENTTHKEHIDLANRRVKHLEEIARKRPLSEHEQGIYDNARRVRDRNAPTQPGDRNNGNPKDLAMAGDADALVPVTPDGEDAHLDASADTPPAAAPAQGPDAVGSTVQGSGTPNPDAPTASAASYPTPPPAGPAGVSAGTQVPAPTPASPSSENPVSATTAASASPALSGSSAGGASPSTGSNSSPSSPSPASVSPAGNGAGSTQPPSYPPIDHSHTIGAEINRRNQATGGHSLLRGDVAIIPGTETDPNAQGVYQARVQMRHPVTGAWIPKTSNGGMNTMFPKHWTEAQIRSEVDAAWNSPHKVIDPTTRIWRAPSPSGIIIEGYINPHRVTAYPKL